MNVNTKQSIAQSANSSSKFNSMDNEPFPVMIRCRWPVEQVAPTAFIVKVPRSVSPGIKIELSLSGVTDEEHDRAVNAAVDAAIRELIILR